MTAKIPEIISDDIFVLLNREESSLFVDTLAEAHELSDAQIFPLSAILGRTATGALKLSELAKTLKEKLGVDEEKAKAIALDILLKFLYPYWPLFDDIDDVISALGGKAPIVKPAMPKTKKEGVENSGQEEEGIAYPSVAAQATPVSSELFGGLDVPLPPEPRRSKNGSQTTENGMSIMERDVPWTPQDRPKNVARPGDVASLLEKNLLQNSDTNTQMPRE